MALVIRFLSFRSIGVIRVVLTRAVGGLVEGIRQLNVQGSGDATAHGRDGLRRGALRYVGYNTLPPHVTNKQGLFVYDKYSTIELLVYRCLSCGTAFQLNYD